MQEYDVALKLLLQGSATLTMRELTGTAVARWLDVELPKVQNLRLDLLGYWRDCGTIKKRSTGLCSGSRAWRRRSGRPPWRSC